MATLETHSSSPTPESALAALRNRIAGLQLMKAAIRLHDVARKAGFVPNQPRVPRGHPDGGQWTSTGGSSRVAAPRNGGQVLSDATPDNFWKPGSRVAQAGPRGRAPGRVQINGQWHTLTPAQAARLTALEVQANAALRRVREIDPTWKPRPSLYETVEGHIARFEGEIWEAEAHLRELALRGLGPGPFARDSIPARGPERNFTVEERREINRMGSETGCHTCGTKNPGTPLGNFVGDHQLPSALNPVGRSQRPYPQCLTCSLRQGGWIRGIRSK